MYSMFCLQPEVSEMKKTWNYQTKYINIVLRTKKKGVIADREREESRWRLAVD